MTHTNQTYLSEIILVTDPALYPVLAQTILMAHPLATPKTLMLAKPIVTVTPVHSLQKLEERCADDVSNARLITCGTDVIVPEAILKLFDHPSYNVHPGLPQYPGRYPSVFSIYDGAKEFGTTVHELAPEIDAGPIVAVDTFPMPENAERGGLEIMSFQSVIRTLGVLTPALLTFGPLSHVDATWSGTAKRQRDFDALCRLPANVDEEEFLRRWRAVGEGPDHALEIELFGHRFCLNNRRSGDVEVAGLKVEDAQSE